MNIKLTTLICYLLCNSQSIYTMHPINGENASEELMSELTTKSGYLPKQVSGTYQPISSYVQPQRKSTPAKTPSSRLTRTRPASPLAHSSSTDERQNTSTMAISKEEARSAGQHIFISVINNFPENVVIIRTTHTPIESDSLLSELISEKKIQTGSHEVKNMYRLKKYGQGTDERTLKLNSIQFIQTKNNTLLKEITGKELENSDAFFGITLTPEQKTQRLNINNQPSPKPARPHVGYFFQKSLEQKKETSKAPKGLPRTATTRKGVHIKPGQKNSSDPENISESISVLSPYQYQNSINHNSSSSNTLPPRPQRSIHNAPYHVSPMPKQTDLSGLPTTESSEISDLVSNKPSDT